MVYPGITQQEEGFLIQADKETARLPVAQALPATDNRASVSQWREPWVTREERGGRAGKNGLIERQ